MIQAAAILAGQAPRNGVVHQHWTCSGGHCYSDAVVEEMYMEQQQVQTGCSQVQTQQTYQHQEYMAIEVYRPAMECFVVLVLIAAATYTALKSIAAGIQRNRDDNEANVRFAEEIIAKHEAEQAQ